MPDLAIEPDDGSASALREALALRKQGHLAESRDLLRAYLVRDSALLWLARVTGDRREAAAAIELAACLIPDDPMVDRAKVTLRRQQDASGDGASAQQELATLVGALTGMTLRQAQAVVWPFRGVNTPLGEALASGSVQLRDLAWACEHVRGLDHVRDAARTLLLARLLGGGPLSRPGSARVIQGSRYSERQEQTTLLLVGVLLGIAAVVFVVMLSVAILLLVRRDMPPWVSVMNWSLVAGLAILDVVVARYVQRTLNYRAGRHGEEQVVEQLRALLDERWAIVRNVTWPDRRWGDIDLVVVGPGGVLACEVKAYRGEVRNVGDRWERRTKRGWAALPVNPGLQARRNAKRLQERLRRAGLAISWVQPVVVWSQGDPAEAAEYRPLAVSDPETPIWTLQTLPDDLGEVVGRSAALPAATVEQAVALLAQKTAEAEQGAQAVRR